MGHCMAMKKGSLTGKSEFLFKDGSWQTYPGFSHSEVGTEIPIIENDYIKLKANGTSKYSGINLSGLPVGYYLFVELTNGLGTNDNTYLGCRFGDGTASYYKSGTYGIMIGEQSSPFTSYKTYAIPVSSSGKMFLAVSSYGVTNNYTKIKSIWLQKNAKLTPINKLNKIELYRNLSPTAYSHNNNTLSSPPFTVEINPVYDYYEIEAVYSNSLKYYGKVIVSKDDLSPNNDANCAGIAVGYIQNGTQALSVSRTIRLNGTTLSFSNSYASNFCLITGIWGLKGTI